MPQRTNLFQEVVEIVHRHLAPGALVEQSAMLVCRKTGTTREVDVVVRGNQAGHEVIVSVEAVGRARKADRPWVDSMVAKHADLPTDKLVLVSEKGFTKDARAAALASNAVPIAPEDLTGKSAPGLPALRPVVANLSNIDYGLAFSEPAPDSGWPKEPRVRTDKGVDVGSLMEVAKALYRQRISLILDELNVKDVSSDQVRRVHVRLDPDESGQLTMDVGGQRRPLFLENEDGAVYGIEWITLTGDLALSVSAQIPLKASRYDEISATVGYGEGQVAGRDALLVLTEQDAGEATLTLRIRPLPGYGPDSTSTND